MDVKSRKSETKNLDTRLSLNRIHLSEAVVPGDASVIKVIGTLTPKLSLLDLLLTQPFLDRANKLRIETASPRLYFDFQDVSISDTPSTLNITKFDFYAFLKFGRLFSSVPCTWESGVSQVDAELSLWAFA